MRKHLTTVCLLVSLICNIAVMAALLSNPAHTVHAQAFAVQPIAASPTATACISGSGQGLICFYGAGTATAPYGVCASFNGGACNPITASAGLTMTGTDPIAVSSTGVISLSYDAALHTGIASLGLTASIPTSSVAVPATSGTLPATTAPVK
jgi:hypothetical protein